MNSLTILNNLIPLSKIPDNLFPYSKRTIYHWEKSGKYKEAFKRIGSKIFVDINKLLELLTNENGGENLK